MAFFSALPSGGVWAVFTEAQLARSSEVTREAIVRWVFMWAFIKLNFNLAVNRRKMMRLSEGTSSTYQHQKLGIIRQVLDEWLAGWSTVFGIVTEDLIRIPTGDIQRIVVAKCHSGWAIKPTGF